MKHFNEHKLIEIFCNIDDFNNHFMQWKDKTYFMNKKYDKKTNSQLNISEVMTIMTFFHYSGFKCFKHYYQQFVQKGLKSYFPQQVSYNRFIELIPGTLPYFYAYINAWQQGEATEKYYIDSTKLPVCHNLRIKSHKVFSGLAARGKTSMGRFYGFKLHLVINHLGEVMRVAFSKGNLGDTHKSILDLLCKNLKGMLGG